MRIGFCVLDANYEKYLKNININNDYYIYSNTKLIKNSKIIPKIEIDFKSHTNYDRFLDLLLAKIKIFSDLSMQYEQVFNFDLDLEFKKDITPILERYSEPYLYGCLEDLNYHRLTDKRKKVLDFIGIEPSQYINAGFMIMNFKYEFNIEEVKWFFKNCPFSSCPEQDFFNWKFRDRIRIMPNDVCWNRFLPPCEDPYIIHHLGFPKKL